MTIKKHITQFAGRKVVKWSKAKTIAPDVAYRIEVPLDDGEDSSPEQWATLMNSLLASKSIDNLQALVTGTWCSDQWDGDTDSDVVLKSLTKLAPQLQNLKALFVAEIVYDEVMPSDLRHGDITPLLHAYPELQTFAIRGSNLRFKNLSHEQLSSLSVQSGGLNPKALSDILSASLPSLTELTLWLGDKDYGGRTSIKDLEPLLSGHLFPRLKHLGLCNSQYSDVIAKAIATSPLLSTIKTLDLSMGTLTDEGARALLQSPWLEGLEFINLRHHYLSNAFIKKVKAKLGDKVDITNQIKLDDAERRYVECSE